MAGIKSFEIIKVRSMKKNLNHSIIMFLFFAAFFTIMSCTKESANKPPRVPFDPTPANNEVDVLAAPIFSWSICDDPENDSVTYDLFLGTTNPPTLLKSNIKVNSYLSDTLNPFTKYYWKVVAKDINNNKAMSPIWNFTTGGALLPPGDLKVVVCDITTTTFFGGAEVFLYKTDSERFSDPLRQYYFRKAQTDNSDPQNLGAIFYALPFQTYYVACRFDLGGGTFLFGVGESPVPTGKTTKLEVMVQ